jgi:MFS family permease
LAGNPFRFLGRHPEFRRYFLGIVPVEFGFQLASVTLGWQVYNLARQTRSIEESAYLVGMIGLAQFGPLFLLTLYAGTLADRASRKAIVLWSLATIAVGTGVLTLVALQPSPSLTAIFALSAVFGASRAFLQPAASALVPMLVSRTDMPQAISTTSLMWMGSVLIGPFFGGLLVASSTALAYGVTTALYLVGIGFTLSIGANTTPERQPGHPMARPPDGPAARGHRLCLAEPHRLRRHLSRPRRRAAGRGDRAFTRLRLRYPARRPAGLRPPPRRPGDGRPCHGGLAVVVPDQARRRGEDVPRSPPWPFLARAT